MEEPLSRYQARRQRLKEQQNNRTSKIQKRQAMPPRPTADVSLSPQQRRRQQREEQNRLEELNRRAKNTQRNRQRDELREKRRSQPPQAMKNQFGFYVAGLQRSGTNYMQQCVTENFGGRCLSIGWHSNWKHHSVKSEDWYKRVNETKPRFFIAIHKNPYTWAESICVRKQIDYIKRQTSVGDASVKQSHDDIIYGKHKISIEHVAKTWAQWVNTWVINKDTLGIPLYVVKYEDMLDKLNVHKLLSEIVILDDMKQLKSSWSVPQKVRQSNDWNENKRTYYRDAKVTLPPDVINLINKHIPDECFEITGHKRMIPET